MKELNGIPSGIVSDLISRIEALDNKYKITLSEVEDQIETTEQDLSGMLGDLTGNDFDMQGLEEFQNILGGN